MNVDAIAATRIQGKTVHGLLMNIYPVLSSYPIMDSEFILQGGRKIQTALDYIHKKGYVHMDVKASNIFVHQETGQWLLGDYGACVKIGSEITSTTFGYYPLKLLGLAARVEYDYYMLGVCLCIQYDKQNGPRCQFMDDYDCLKVSVLKQFVHGLADEELKNFICTLITFD